jgi:glycosyltransferase involved in cell wall biosynthesis
MMLSEGIKSDYIPEGVTLYDFESKKHISKTVGFAGRLEKHKGIDYLINAMPTVISSMPDVKLLIAGEGAYKDSLVKLVSRLKLDNNVIFLSHLSRSEMKKFYKDIDIFVMASSPAETFGKVGVEAMSAGKPVLAPNVGGISDWLKDGINGYFIDKEDPIGTAHTVVTLLAEPEKIKSMAQAGRKIAETFTMELYVDKHEAYFKKILKQKTKEKLKPVVL